MTAPPSTAASLVFANLLELLRRQGVAIGVDHYLRLYTLLDRVGDSCSPEQLKTLVCPLIATSREQQEQVYIAFDQCYRSFHGPSEIRGLSADAGSVQPGAGPTHSHPSKRQRRWWIAGAAGMASVLVAIAVLVDQSSPPPPTTAPTMTSPDTAVPSAVVPPVTVAPTVVADTTVHGDESPKPGFGVRHHGVLSVLAVIAPALLLAGFEVVRYRRRKAVIRKERRERPPFVWPVRVPAAGSVFAHADALLATAQALRRRERGDTLRLDIEATIQATVASFGYPSFRFSSESRPAEYVILVECTTFRDHQAALYDDLTTALGQEGVLVTRYFFDGDPRVCYREPGEVGTPISELSRRYPSHRLLVFGSGAGMLDPISGNTKGWVDGAMLWHDRALLTPEPVARWGNREIALARQFVVLPASLATLRRLRDVFDASGRGGSVDLSGAGEEKALELPPNESDANAIVQALRAQLSPDEYRWISACALYPELQWDLTLYLSGLAAIKDAVANEASILRLVTLPWFRVGSIPDPVRSRLIADLDPALAESARLAIIDLLERNPPPEEAAAASRYQLDLAVQRLAVRRRDRTRQRELLRALERVPRGQILRDRALLELLESVPRLGPSVVLPSRLRRLVFNHGVPIFGWNTTARYGTTVAAMVAVGLWWNGTRRPANPQPLVTASVSDTASSDVIPSPPDPAVVVSIEMGDVRALTVGETTRLTASAVNALGAAATGASIDWSSSDRDVATVSSEGILTARGAGSAVIRASAGGRSAERSVTVRAPVVRAPPPESTRRADPPPPPKTEAELRAEVLGVLTSYVGAIQARDTSRIRRVFPTATDGLMTRLQTMFNDARSAIQLTGAFELLDTPREAAGSQVRARYRGRINFLTRGAPVGQPVDFLLTLQRDGGTWRIVNIR